MGGRHSRCVGPQPSIGVCLFVDTNFFVTFRSMTCRLWIFLEAAAGGPSRTFVRSSPRRLRAYRDFPLRPPIFLGADIALGSTTDATPKYRQVLWMATFGSFINLREKLFVKPATGLSTASAALPW